VTQLRKMMLVVITLRLPCERLPQDRRVFSQVFHHSSDQLGPEEIRTYQVYLLTERKAGCAHCRTPHGSITVLLLQDPEAQLSRGGSAVSESAPALADHPDI
jgi:hypothetical protein